MFITFEGIDASGKTTQCKRIVSWLEESGHTVHLVREPGGTAISEKIREILLDPVHEQMNSAAELFLFSAARAQLTAEFIIPALNRGEIVVADRFYDSTTAYQGYGRNMNVESIIRINDLSSHGVTPDLTVYLDIDYEESVRRRLADRLQHDRIEQMDSVFFNAIRQGYAAIAEREKRFHIIEGTLPVDRITGDIQDLIRQLMKRG